MPYAVSIDILAEFQKELVGYWKNENFGIDECSQPVGGKDNPLSYNVMPLPQPSDPDGYILKNFKYSERLKFNDDNVKKTLAIAAEAPNRGGLVSQNARAIFYEQQVKFAEGPDTGKVVHVENGTWLWLPRFVQQDGPYPMVGIDTEPVTDALNQPANLSIAKQIAVPHGNSILALGSFDTFSKSKGDAACEKKPKIKGSPAIPDAPLPYPMPIIAVPNPLSSPSLISNLNIDARYTTERSNISDFQNPHPDLTRCTNKPLQQAVAIIKPDSYMHWHVTTEPQPNLSDLEVTRGHVIDIPFELRVSDVTEYWADYWMLFKGRKKYLAYTQTILMKMTIQNQKYIFPHVTCNTVTYV
jgi:hypothetical protein